MEIAVKDVNFPISLREYQRPVFDALEYEGYKRILYIAPRRAGKDYTAWQLALLQAVRTCCQIFYVLPSYAQGKKVIFDGITSDGKRFIDLIPKELIKSKFLLSFVW